MTVLEILSSLTKYRTDPILTSIIKSVQLIAEDEHHNTRSQASDKKGNPTAESSPFGQNPKLKPEQQISRKRPKGDENQTRSLQLDQSRPDENSVNSNSVEPSFNKDSDSKPSLGAQKIFVVIFLVFFCPLIFLLTLPQTFSFVSVRQFCLMIDLRHLVCLM